MSDLLSPILYVVQNEVDAFWCFCGFMELVVRLGGGGPAPFRGPGCSPSRGPPPQHGNFEESQETMKRQLGQLLLLLRVLDPPLCDFLGTSRWSGDGRATGVARQSVGWGAADRPGCLVPMRTRETSGAARDPELPCAGRGAARGTPQCGQACRLLPRAAASPGLRCWPRSAPSRAPLEPGLGNRFSVSRRRDCCVPALNGFSVVGSV